jgi:hypothetical protein
MEKVRTARNVARAGIVLIAVVGLIHLIEAPEYFETAAYVGLLFLANGIGAAVSAYGIYRDAGWGWTLGVLVAGGAFVAYILSRTVGLPGAPGLAQEGFFEPLGLVSLSVEVLFLFSYAARTSSHTLRARREASREETS